MRVAGRFASDVLDYITPTSSPASPPSRSTICAPSMAEQGTKTACLGYQPPGMTPYPAYVCTSVNHVVPRHPQRQAAQEGRHRQCRT
jgi:methionyl aminopeptidase